MLFFILTAAFLHIWTLTLCPFVILFHPLANYCLVFIANCLLLFFTPTGFRFSNLVSYHSSITACNIACCLYYCQHCGNFSLLLFFVSVILFHSLTLLLRAYNIACSLSYCSHSCPFSKLTVSF